MNIVIGNIVSFVGNLIDFIFNLKFNKKAKILICNCFSSTFSLIAFVFLRAYDGVIECAVTILRLITIYLKDKYNKKCYLLFFLFIGLYSLVFLKFNGIQTIILFLSAMCSFIPKWLLKDMQKIRIGGLCSIALSVIYNIIVSNYAVIIIQIINFIMITITIIKWYNNNKKGDYNE